MFLHNNIIILIIILVLRNTYLYHNYKTYLTVCVTFILINSNFDSSVFVKHNHKQKIELNTIVLKMYTFRLWNILIRYILRCNSPYK